MFDGTFDEQITWHKEERNKNILRNRSVEESHVTHSTPLKTRISSKTDLSSELPSSAGPQRALKYQKSLGWRWESDWHEAQVEEDRFLLFGESSRKSGMDFTYYSRPPHDTSEIGNCLRRWAVLRQNRYFWDFLERYETQDEITRENQDQIQSTQEEYDIEIFDQLKREATVQRLAKQRLENIKYQDKITKPARTMSSTPDIHVVFPDGQTTSSRQSFHRQDKIPQALVFEICQTSLGAKLSSFFKTWCEDQDNEKVNSKDMNRLMNFFDSRIHPSFQVNHFEKIYKTPSDTEIDSLREIVAKANPLKEKGKKKRMSQSKEGKVVGGGRYLIR